MRALREKCDETMQKIQERRESGPPDDDADKYFQAFQLAIETQNARLVSAALDCIQKLMAYGYLTGKIKVSSESGKEEKA